LLGEREAWRDSGVSGKELADYFGTIALTAPVQQDDMGRKPGSPLFATIQNLSDGFERLLV
jgi:hypothetical protein